MAGRRKSGIFDAVMDLVSHLPWFVSVPLFCGMWIGWDVEIYTGEVLRPPFPQIYKLLYLAGLLAVGFGTVISVGSP